jgi:hypothetical protein
MLNDDTREELYAELRAEYPGADPADLIDLLDAAAKEVAPTGTPGTT